MIDETQAPNAASGGIPKSLAEQIDAGRGNWSTPDSASFLVSRDPYRAIRRGRQIFQREVTRLQLQGPGMDDGFGDINSTRFRRTASRRTCTARSTSPPGPARSRSE